ncbi:MAG TPA: 50S ribosomal protein L31, partial [Terriglobales bacterium]
MGAIRKREASSRSPPAKSPSSPQVSNSRSTSTRNRLDARAGTSAQLAWSVPIHGCLCFVPDSSPCPLCLCGECCFRLLPVSDPCDPCQSAAALGVDLHPIAAPRIQYSAAKHPQVAQIAAIPVQSRFATSELGSPMKAAIHPVYNEVRVHCACGNAFMTRSTHKGD